MHTLLESRFARLENLREQVNEELLSMQGDCANQPPGELQWSAVQVASHIYIAEAGSLKYMQKKMQAGDQLKHSGIKGRLRTWILRKAMHASIKFKAPEIIAHPDNDLPAPAMIEKWNVLRMELRSFLEQVPEKYYRTELFRHPLMGRMSLLQGLDFMAQHLERHLKQVRRIKAELNNPEQILSREN